ncbi:MAG TPA: TonB-dependent receptor [Sphingomonas sp.]|nr:TonB-dependent receptor [Sphingomonas sp.]
MKSVDRPLTWSRFGVWVAFLGVLSARAGAEGPDLASMSIEELAQIEVTSVSKSAQPLGDAPAAIYAITHDDILRSGATSIPEMLRLAPNLQVAQITASRYAVSARGFNSSLADKLLALVDGRSIYTPFSSGVNWEMQQVAADDIERIEVISGPGGTLWGANAVNGVVNILTRKSSDTQGVSMEAGGGNSELRGRLRYGGKLSDDLTYRFYVGGFDHRNVDLTAAGAKAQDAWHKIQSGFRADWQPADDAITVQGDIYDGAEQQLSSPHQAMSGHNLLARWIHDTGSGSSLQVQAYYDHVQFSVPGYFANKLDTYDIQAQQNVSLGNHVVVWGGGYRLMRDDFPTILSPVQAVAFDPQSRTLTLWNLFLQDTLPLTDRLKLTAGIKLEREPYTGLEVMPNMRLSWPITNSGLLWLSASRAVRIPSRIDRDAAQYSGPTVVLAGGDMQAVKVTAFELGYRAQPLPDLSFSVSTFYNLYPNLRSAEYTHGGLPITFENGMKGETYGVEFWANYSPARWWRLMAGANWLHKDLRFKHGSSRLGGIQIAGNDPDYQLSLRSAMDLGRGVSFDLALRRIGALPAPPSPAYTELNARLAWAVSDQLEFSATGSNLLHKRHTEFSPITNTLQVGPVGVQIRRSLSVEARWKI